jgi:hypothetical protein
MKGILVQVLKGNMQNGKLNIVDLKQKLAVTIATLKVHYGKTFGKEENAAEKKKATFVSAKENQIIYYNSLFLCNLKKDVLKHVGQEVKSMSAELFRFKSRRSEAAMEKRLKAFAGTLLYLLEKIQMFFMNTENAQQQRRRRKRHMDKEKKKKILRGK